MKKITIILLVLAVVGAGLLFTLKKKPPERNYRTEKIARGSIRATVTATGTVNPVTAVLVGTQVSGTIKRLYVDFNSIVKKGQLLAQIDPATFEAQVAQARANQAVSKANVEKAEAALLDASRVRERNKALFGRNLIAKSDLDTSETNELSARAQVQAAKAQVEQTTAALQAAETNLRYTSIVSPVDGMVISRNVDVGQTVAASFQTPTLFNIAQDLSKMQIDTNVDEADIGRIRMRQPVEFTVDAYPDKTFRGRVSAIRNAPINVQNVVTYDVVVMVENPGLMLKPGMTANVSVITAQKSDILMTPNSALRFKPVGGGGKRSGQRERERGPALWTPDKTKPRRVKVALGITDGTNTEIVSGDVKEGDEVIVSAAESKNNGQSGLFSRRLFH